MASNSLEALSQKLVESLKTAQASLCVESLIKPVPQGISLLDTKNELALSYLQHLTFLILLKVRDGRRSLQSFNGDSTERTSNQETLDKIVNTLVEIRVFLERGVKPLESRLRYQIDKVVRAADDANRKPNDAATPKPKGSKSIKSNGKAHSRNSGVDEESTDTGSDSESSEEIDRFAFRPNPSAIKRAEDSSNSKTNAAAGSGASSVYRPPRIAPTLMPDARPNRAERAATRPQKSSTLDEFVATELSTAPIAEPSIGTTIRQGGRRSFNARERQDAREREAYEEAHFVRLPKESKAERRKQSGRARDGWGGEEWHDLGRGAERVVSALSKGKRSGDGSRVRQALERSRKRDREVSDAPPGGRPRIGDAFDGRKRMLEDRAKRRKTR